MTLRDLLIEWPVKLFNAWWMLYSTIWLVMFMAVGTITLIALVLALFGVRWGW
jgi:hypothetical protein